MKIPHPMKWAFPVPRKDDFKNCPELGRCKVTRINYTPDPKYYFKPTVQEPVQEPLSRSKRIMQLYKLHTPVAKILQTLYAEGYRTKYGNVMSIESLKSVLHGWIEAGTIEPDERVWKKLCTRKPGLKRKRKTGDQND